MGRTARPLDVFSIIRSGLRRPLTNALLEPPQPWLNPDRSLLVVWSAKSASSLTFIWYLATVGLLDDYRASGMSSHEYRGKRLARSDVVQRGRSKLLDDYWIVHILRDPYLRAVSSYRHALATGYADKRIGPRSGGSLDRKEGFSFARYLDYLETIDLRGANVHHRLQLHRVERIKPPDTRDQHLPPGICLWNSIGSRNCAECRSTDFGDLRSVPADRGETPRQSHAFRRKGHDRDRI